jgi:hypothetical protein
MFALLHDRRNALEFLGSMERLAAQIYPYRWFIAAILPFLLLGAGLLIYRKGWYLILWRRKLATAIVLVPLLVVSIPVSYYLLSPLWTRTTVVEESPLAVASGLMPQQATSTAEPAATATAVPPTPSPTTEPTPPSAVDPQSTPLPAQPAATETVVAPPTPEPAATVTPEPTAEPTPEPEPEPTEFVPYVVRAGEFVGADEFHFGSGTVLLIATAADQFVVRLEEFSVRNGPDLFVYLSTNPDGWSEDALNLGELRATDGSLNYDVPAGVDVSQYQSVVIWCRAFAVLFSTASFE